MSIPIPIINGVLKMKEANAIIKNLDEKNTKNLGRFNYLTTSTNEDMDNLGNMELKILASFDKFNEIFEKIHSKPEFDELNKNGIRIPDFQNVEYKNTAAGASILLKGLSSAAVGTAAGFAAAGATTSAFMAFGTASTGTAISSLSGVAATNATLAAIGGGSLAVGGGGVALGSAILSIGTFGIALIVGSVIFELSSSAAYEKAGEVASQVSRTERQINNICDYLIELGKYSQRFCVSLSKVKKVYDDHLAKLEKIVITNKKTDWKDFTAEDKLITENTVLLVSLLYSMCKVQLVYFSDNPNGINNINVSHVNESIERATDIMDDERFGFTTKLENTSVYQAIAISENSSKSVSNMKSNDDDIDSPRLENSKKTLSQVENEVYELIANTSIYSKYIHWRYLLLENYLKKCNVALKDLRYDFSEYDNFSSDDSARSHAKRRVEIYCKGIENEFKSSITYDLEKTASELIEKELSYVATIIVNKFSDYKDFIPRVRHYVEYNKNMLSSDYKNLAFDGYTIVSTSDCEKNETDFGKCLKAYINTDDISKLVNVFVKKHYQFDKVNISQSSISINVSRKTQSDQGFFKTTKEVFYISSCHFNFEGEFEKEISSKMQSFESFIQEQLTPHLKSILEDFAYQFLRGLRNNIIAS